MDHPNLCDKVMTAETVRAKVFATARLRPGYDLADVDVFLSEVETSLRWLHQENARLAALANNSGGLSPRTAALMITHAQEEAAAIITQAETRARDLVEEARETARHAAEILGEAHAAGTRERRQLEERLAQLQSLIGRLSDG
ncbi:hypothetical protein Acor_38890 [Acrocarpospora corrugata]|uniref:Antigen 84 n=1 Tax=Acrocarpospora corrugata TaxID=35763 RepID=A0A5M3VZG0_9ACTN|nr:hypothetical protein Acor_38890 [Acrocarpospora corrugata]